MTSTGWPAPAKINLFLHIVGRRADGYHELQTVFQFLDFADELTFDCSEAGEVRRAGNNAGVVEKDDLVVRAAWALRQAAGINKGATITIDKRIPLGGGLGGGSADAATTLVALNALWGVDLPVEELARIGLRIGADVPVFIHGRAAWAEGVGEKLTPVAVSEDWFLVVHPGCQVSTARVFNAPDLTRNTPPITIADFLAGAGHNDCEPVVFAAYPEIARAADWLGQWAEVRMTGTGACLYARFGDHSGAVAVLNRLPPEWQGFIAQGKNRSPLLARLERERRGSTA